MQDRFRFRAWNKNDKIMIYNAEFAYDTMTMNNGLLIDITQETPVFQLDYFGEYLEYYPYYEVMQSTGLKDKNGKLIYEKDIIRFYFDNDEIIAVIEWDNDECRFYLNTTDYFKDKYVTDYEIVKQEEYEVIGNRYQNPELLEVQNADNEWRY